jgi:hypothetical protein
MARFEIQNNDFEKSPVVMKLISMAQLSQNIKDLKKSTNAWDTAHQRQLVNAWMKLLEEEEIMKIQNEKKKGGDRKKGEKK